MPSLTEIRRDYAARIRVVGNLRSQALVDAFAKVPRELFLGPGPWQILHPGVVGADYVATIDDDPARLYEDVVVAIDPVRKLNNGQPSYLAYCLDSLDLGEGDRFVHVGCGVGYYTAIAAEVVGPRGQVVGIEIDENLAARARRNLSYLSHVEVIHGDGGGYDTGPCDAIFVNAGATHVRPVWLDCLRPGGRLTLYLTVAFDDSSAGKGGMLKVTREDAGYTARFLSPVAVFHCLGSRDEGANERLRAAMEGGQWRSVRSLRRDPHEPIQSCWLHAHDFCLSTRSSPRQGG
jgi:protein-L-isoaspartate(D-aspartate) O-methyltransferase